MIRRELENDWFLITQPEHARLSGFLGGHWAGRKSAQPEPRDEVVLAAAQHDNGWREWEERPSLNAEGAPAFMYENPIEEVFKIGDRGIRRLSDEGHPYAAAMVSLHYVNWARDILTGVRKIRPITPELRTRIEGFKIEEEKRQAALRRRVGEMPEFAADAAPDRIHRNGRYLWVFDMLSLILCCRWPHVETLREVPLANGGEGFGDLSVQMADDRNLHVSPWPFDAESLEFSVRGRRLPPKPFSNTSDFHAALEDVPWSEIDFKYLPG